MISVEEIKNLCKGKNILLVEDNEINAMITEMQLKTIGLNVEWVSDGAQGLTAFLASDNHHFSCVITDLMMPVMDGIETSKRIRKCGRADASLPIVAITANAYVNKAMAGRGATIDKMFIKPYDKQELWEWIYDKICEFEEIDESVSKAQ